MTYYVIKDAKQAEPDRIVNANNLAQAIRHAAKRYTAKPATNDDIVKYLTDGGLLETAGDVDPADAQQAVLRG